MIWVPKFLTKLRDIPAPVASKFLKRNAGDTAFEWADAGGGSSQQYMMVREEKAFGGGGTANMGYNTRILNTVVVNTIAGASLASNQITLPAGTYRITANAPGTVTGNAVERLSFYNVTDSITVAFGAQNACSGYNYERTPLWGRFTISAQKTFELRHYFSGSRVDIGLGSQVTSEGFNLVFAQVQLIKE